MLNPQLQAEPFDRVLILGLGVIGGSIALGLHARGRAKHIVGYAFQEDMDAALKAGAIQSACTNETLATEIQQADLVMLCLPVTRSMEVVPLIAQHLRADALLTDVCSVKCALADVVRTHLGSRYGQYVPGHPIAGSHKSGFEGAQAGLFFGATVILGTAPSASLQTIDQLWKALGAKVQIMTNQRHDELYANVSHLPHVAAYGLMNAIEQLTLKHGEQAVRDLDSQVGNGFLNMTRIAASSPELWADILVLNRQTTHIALKEFIQQLQELDVAIDTGDKSKLALLLSRAAKRRQQFKEG